MARKGGRGGNKAARSAAAKKGWETRRRGGAKAKPAATKRTATSKAKPTAKRGGMLKTTSARGRALTNQRRAADLVRASRGGKGPSAKAVRSVLTAQRARAFYAATGGGKKRSAVKAKSAAKIGKSIRAEGRAKATAARAKVAGRPRSRVVAKPAAQRPAARPVAAAKPIPKLSRDQRIQANEAKMAGVKLAAYDLRAKLPKKKRDDTGRSTVGGLLLKISGREISRQQYGGISDLIGPRGIAGVRTRMNANGTISLSMSSVAKAQAMIGEKRATRPRRRRRS